MRKKNSGYLNEDFALKRAEKRKWPVIYALLSLIVPGLGQILLKEIRRGLLVFASLVTMFFIFIWRISLIGHGEPTLFAMFRKSMTRKPLFVFLVLVGMMLIWLITAFESYIQAKKGQRGGFKVFVLLIAVFFVLGWEISEISPYKMVTKFTEALTPLSRVLWPWEAAIKHKTEVISAKAPVLVPCGKNPPGRPVEKKGKPYIWVEPTCGNLSRLDKNNKIVEGTVLTVRGKNFKPNTKTDIWWIDPIGNEFRLRQHGKYVSLTTDNKGMFTVKIIMPYRLMPPSAEGRQIHHVEARQVSPTGGIVINDPLKLTISRMVETIFMGMMATLFGIIFAIPISFLAARNLMSGSWITLVIYYITRTILNVVRSIEPLIWALIAVVWVGLGPFAGIIALTFHSVAALGKLYSEAIESIDPGPIEAIQATGATHLQTIMYAVVPQMIPPFVSFSIYRWDINVRMSTVIGLVGGGGIGFLLVQYIRLLDYRAAGIAVWFIALTVALLDYVSAEIRRRFV